MKKTYITPAIFEHKLRVESQILANSPIKSMKIEWGNEKKEESLYGPEETQTNIEAVEGPGFGNI